MSSNFQKTFLIGAGIAAGVVIGTRKRKCATGLAGRVVLITGGSRGLGLAMAREFSAAGCRILVCARDSGELSALRDDPELAGNISTFQCDVSSKEQVDRMIDEAMAQFGRIDILVNNAGQIQVGPVKSMTEADFEAAMNVMFWGVVHSTLAVLPHMLARREGSIVTITSIGGKVAVPHLLPYACAKFAAVAFSEGLRSELWGDGVKVTTIVPGLMRTGSFRKAWFKGNAEQEAVWFSLAATLPGISIDATRAARQVVAATRRGQSEKILSLPANLLALCHGLFPGMTTDMLGCINRWLLPKGTGSRNVQGSEINELNTKPMQALTALGRRAEAEFNQTL
jgi:NAD(P)-dependent dehydrogenase (short-subunit alcohol dehydrogenase family)